MSRTARGEACSKVCGEEPAAPSRLSKLNIFNLYLSCATHNIYKEAYGLYIISYNSVK